MLLRPSPQTVIVVVQLLQADADQGRCHSHDSARANHDGHSRNTVSAQWPGDTNLSPQELQYPAVCVARIEWAAGLSQRKRRRGGRRHELLLG